MRNFEVMRQHKTLFYGSAIIPALVLGLVLMVTLSPVRAGGQRGKSRSQVAPQQQPNQPVYQINALHARATITPTDDVSGQINFVASTKFWLGSKLARDWAHPFHLRVEIHAPESTNWDGEPLFTWYSNELRPTHDVLFEDLVLFQQAMPASDKPYGVRVGVVAVQDNGPDLELGFTSHQFVVR